MIVPIGHSILPSATRDQRVIFRLGREGFRLLDIDAMPTQRRMSGNQCEIHFVTFIF